MPTYTARQRETLECIRDSLIERGIAPTLGELAEQLGGIARVSVLDHLRALERKGAIARKARESRAIEILDEEFRPTRGIPLAGTIAAGEAILAVEDRSDVELGEFLGVHEDCYLLRVSGESMIEDHIQDGDLVLVEPTSDARDGDMVVAVVHGEGGDEATLKRLYREGSAFRLQPANATMQPRMVAFDELEVRGIVRGVIRRV
ncbi:MAG: transcriptional repressor LexA [Planctomycetota bacterium]